MANASSIKIEGLDALRRNLQALPERLQRKALSNAVAKGGQVILKDARRRVPVLKDFDPRRTPGLLKKVLRATRGVRRATEASAFVSVRRLSKQQIARFKKKMGKGASNNALDPFYWRFVEFGTSKMAAQPFLRPAFDNQKEQAARTIAEALDAAIQKEARLMYRRIL